MTTVRLKLPILTLDEIERSSIALLLFMMPVAIPSNFKTPINLLGYLFAAIIFVRHWKKFLYVFSKDITFVFILTLAVLSLMWSTAPEASIQDLRGLIKTTMFGIYLATVFSPREFMSLFTKICLAWLSLSFLFIILPGHGIGQNGEWQGIFPFKNVAGSLIALLGTISAVKALYGQESKPLWIASFAASALFIWFSRSVTSLGFFLLALSLLPAHRILQYRFRLNVVMSIVALLLSAFFVAVLAYNISEISALFGKSSDLTGRIPIWQAIVQESQGKQWFGYGYSAFWYTESGLDVAYEYGWPQLPRSGTYLTTMHSHNGYLELYVQLGFFGLVMFFLNLSLVVFRTLSLYLSTKELELLWLIQVLAMLLAYNLTEIPTILEGNQLYWVIYAYICFSTAVQKALLSKSASRIGSH